MKRQSIIFIVALFALCGSIIAALTTAQQRDWMLRGYVDPTQNADLPFRLPLLGVNAQLLQYTPDELRTHFDLMTAAHITWVRQTVDWSSIEQVQNNYAWEQWDQLIEVMRDYPNLRLVAVIVNTPAWARTPRAPNHPTAPPQDPAHYAAFAAAFAERYGNIVDYYQLWDEPNLDDGWGLLEPRPVDYFALLQAGYTAVHSADAGAIVIMGGLAPTIEEGPLNISDITYLRQLYALGAGDFIDAVAAKPYGFNTPPDTDRRVEPAVLNFSRIIALREIMVANGDGRKALWADEWGWNALPPEWTGDASIWGSVSLEQQSAYTLAALQRAEREWPWIGGMILHQWQPDAPSDDPQWGFAVVDQQDQPTPLYAALTAFSPPVTAQNGLYPAANPYAEYSGVWTFGLAGADIGWLNDSQLAFDFMGRDVALLLREDDYVAYLYCTIDSQPANALPQDNAGHAYIVLTSASGEPESNLVVVGRDLNHAQHTLRAVADRGWDRWALIGYAVSSGNLATPYNQQITIAWLTSALAALAVFVSARQLNWTPIARPFTTLWTKLGDAGEMIVSMVTSFALLLGMFLTWNDATSNFFRREEVQLGLSLATAGLIYLEPGLLLTLAAGALLFIIFYNRLYIGLLLTIFWSPFFLFPVELLRFAFPMNEMMILLTTAAWLLRQLAQIGRDRQTTISQFRSEPLYLQLQRFTMMDWGMLAWVLLGVISLSWAANRAPALTELRTMIIEPALFYLIFRTLKPNRQQIIAIVDALLAAALLVIIIGFILYIAGDAIGGNRGVIEAEGGARRLASVYGSPNNVALFIGRCVPFALAYALLPVDRRRRFIAAGLCGALLITALFTLSAGALFLGIPAAVVSVLLFTRGRRALPTLGILGVLGVLSVAIAVQFERFARLLDFTSGTNFFRLRVWESSVNILRDHPITGLGLDQFLYAFRGAYILPDAEAEPTLSHPHNFVLDFWIRLSIFGVLVFLWLQLAFWRALYPVYRHLRETKGDVMLLALCVGTMGSMINLLAHGLIDNSVFVHDLCYIFVLLLALSGIDRTLELLTNRHKLDVIE